MLCVPAPLFMGALPGGLVKTITWYDNGWGYAARIIDTALTLGAFAVEEVQR